MELLQRLEQWRVYNNMSLEKLAQELGVTYGTVHRWCRKGQTKILPLYEDKVKDFIKWNVYAC